MDGGAKPPYLRAMLRKWLIALLTLCLAAPAVALPACHSAPAQAAVTNMAPMDHGGHHAPATAPDENPLDQLRVTHGCIGCATPPPVLLGYAPTLWTMRDVLWRQPDAQLHAVNVRPDTPPPRG